MPSPEDLLIPRPRTLARRSDAFLLPRTLKVAGAALADTRLAPLERELARLGHRLERASVGDLRLRIARGGAADDEGYRLDIGERGIDIEAASESGLFYGLATLVQWLRITTRGDRQLTPRLDGLHVVDRPDFRHRGVMLDVSRNKVPTLTTLFALVDLLAGWKINQLQLYMEHTFAYRGHETVWRAAGAYTSGDIERLDAYCRARSIELVPNQNSFGHFHRWLIHEPYRRLAECPDGVEHPFSRVPEPFSLCPLDTGSLELIADLYDQLLPCFTSKLLNTGLDETLDLGQCRSAAACAERGRERVYLDFLQRVHRLVSERGHRMQFWGDILLQRPELIAELPRDAIALEWGYEADHPFAEDCRRFADSGLDFYVCPGTSAWNSFAGRTRNALLNLANAAVNGHAQGALGYLVTDWGDHGHLQPLPVSFPGLLAGAAFAWNTATASEPLALPLVPLLDLHVYPDLAGAGQAIVDLGMAYLETGAQTRNGSVLFFGFLFGLEALAERGADRPTVAGLERAVAYLDRVPTPLAGQEVHLSLRELSWVANLLRLACRSLRAQLEGRREPALQREIESAAADLRELWLARNREPGLEASIARLSQAIEQL